MLQMGLGFPRVIFDPQVEESRGNGQFVGELGFLHKRKPFFSPGVVMRRVFSQKRYSVASRAEVLAFFSLSLPSALAMQGLKVILLGLLGQSVFRLFECRRAFLGILSGPKVVFQILLNLLIS